MNEKCRKHTLVPQVFILEKALAFSSQNAYNLTNDFWNKVALKFGGKSVSLEANLTYDFFVWNHHTDGLEIGRDDLTL